MMRWKTGWLVAVVVTAATLMAWACDPLPKPADPPGPATVPSEAQFLERRPYKSWLPGGFDPDAGTHPPLVIVLAGYGGEAIGTAEYIQLDRLVDAGQFIVALPNGVRDGAGNLAWHPDAIHSPYFDVEYLEAVIHDQETRNGIDPKRIYVAGHSQGAHMAHRMACDDSSEVAAIVSVAGQVTMVPSQCAPDHPVSVLQVHGTVDSVIGYTGDVQNYPPDPTIPSAHQTVAVWARNDKCTGPIALTGQTFDFDFDLIGNETAEEAYSGCPAGIDVKLWSIDGGEHDPFFNDSFAPAMMGFFTDHPHL